MPLLVVVLCIQASHACCVLFAELYMVQDKSRDFLDTWDFLETRISDIKDLGKIYDDVNISSERYLVSFSYHFTLSLSLSLSLSLVIYRLASWQKVLFNLSGLESAL